VILRVRSVFPPGCVRGASSGFKRKNRPRSYFSSASTHRDSLVPRRAIFRGRLSSSGPPANRVHPPYISVVRSVVFHLEERCALLAESQCGWFGAGSFSGCLESEDSILCVFQGPRVWKGDRDGGVTRCLVVRVREKPPQANNFRSRSDGCCLGGFGLLDMELCC